MSFQQSTATALPAEVQLAKEKPQGAFCLRTRYALSANSANSWLPGALCSLPLQTGTPGTFTDVKQGNINCTLQISNTNPYVDFLNFGPCGAMIFFDEMRVYSSGTPVEENLRYSETVDLLMEQGGWQSRPLHVFRRNKWRANNGRAGDKHINFIKPSMVDAYGCPMFGRTPFMDKNSAVYQPPAIAFGYNGATPVQNFALGSVSKASAANTFSHGSLVGQDSGYTFNDDGLYAPTTARAATNFYTSATDGQGFQTQVVVGRNSTCVKLTTPTGVVTNAINDLGGWKNTQVGRTSSEGANTATYPWLPCASYVPSQWPDYQPCTLSGEVDDFEVDNIIGKTKVAEYMKYLANVRSLPVGVRGNNDGLYTDNCAELLAPASAVQNLPSCRFMEYRVSMPFLSGIYGILADKMFPDLLIGANNIRIEFKLAQPGKALWLTMDPLRRVPGTVRDFSPFCGNTTGSSRGAGEIVAGLSWPATDKMADIALGAATSTALGCFQSRVLGFDSTAVTGSLYSSAILFTGTQTPATAQTASVLNASDGYTIVRNSNMYNTASAMGEDLVPTQQQGVVDGTTATIVNSTDISVAAGHYNPFSGLPKPQYVPTAAPWSCKAFFNGATFNQYVVSHFVNERASCYGTYLPASTPQVRRCQFSSRLGVSDSFNNAVTTYAIRDLQYIGEQVQLDDLSASAIIQMAASSEVVVWSRGYRSFEADCTVGEQQNIILPIQIGQATALYLIFRPGSQMSSFDHYSNSFSCPFTGVSFAPGAGIGLAGSKVAPDVGGTYIINSSLDTQNNGLFSYQLFSGTKQYPLQPVQTVVEMLVEREKSTHSLHNWSWCGTENMNLIQWGTPYNQSTTTGLNFDPFLDLGFFTAYVPTLALDDQTITQNPYFTIVELSEGGTGFPRVRGIRQSPSVNANASSFTGVLNTFVPPVGTFFLGWDFESWTNHDDLMRTGKFLGQEQLTVRMTGTYLMTAQTPQAVNGNALTQSIRCTAIVPHIVKLSFVPGGHMLTYY